MTKEAIELEIKKLNQKIRISKLRISDYRNKIKKLEEGYSKSNNLNKSFHGYIDSYYSSIVSQIQRLDRDSAFGSYYTSKINSIFKGKEMIEIESAISKGKKDIIRQIDDCEAQIIYENRNIQQYKTIIQEYQKQLMTLE